MIVLVNKMDIAEPPWSEARYNEIKGEVGTYLKRVGYAIAKMLFIPISGFQGDNMMEKSDNTSWY
jgi:elongation factor 1-alpha